MVVDGLQAKGSSRRVLHLRQTELEKSEGETKLWQWGY